MVLLYFAIAIIITFLSTLSSLAYTPYSLIASQA